MNKNIKKHKDIKTCDDELKTFTKKLLANLINKVDMKTISIRKPVYLKEANNMHDYNDLYEELEELEEFKEFEELNKNIRKQPETAVQPEPVKETKHFGVYIDGVVNCTACGSDEEQFKCSNYRQRTNGFGCSFLFNLKDCMSIDVQQQIRDKN